MERSIVRARAFVLILKFQCKFRLFLVSQTTVNGGHFELLIQYTIYLLFFKTKQPTKTIATLYVLKPTKSKKCKTCFWFSLSFIKEISYFKECFYYYNQPLTQILILIVFVGGPYLRFTMQTKAHEKDVFPNQNKLLMYKNFLIF